MIAQLNKEKTKKAKKCVYLFRFSENSHEINILTKLLLHDLNLPDYYLEVNFLSDSVTPRRQQEG
jgi:hypothetical protein